MLPEDIKAQNFEEAPLSCTIMAENKGGATAQITVLDYSRYGRHKRKLETVQKCPDQTKIIDFFSITNEIDQLTTENKKLQHLLRSNECEMSPDLLLSSCTPILRQLMSNAEKNASKLPHGRRHSDKLKKFATSLFIYAGPLAYDFLQQNLSQALPFLRTVQRLVHSDYKTISEGKFRFDELVEHIAKHNGPNIVSIGEDATRVISRVEYDSKTDRCVGFVLPLDRYGLPKSDTFLAVSFEAIERVFSENQMARYAYVYMAKPLSVNIPPFCLACFGTDNKFTTEHIMLRWKYIVQECQKRGLKVLSFGSDGDTRLLTAMQVCAGLKDSKCNVLLDLIPKPILAAPKVPSKWHPWFCLQRPSSIAYVQDIVHIGVKLKCRLLKPSVILPMGSCVAGVHHIRILMATYGKDIHGLREKDVDHKDKQNFDAVINIVKAAHLLESLPDSKATKQYVELMQCVVDSYLSKELSPTERIEKIWYPTFLYVTGVSG